MTAAMSSELSSMVRPLATFVAAAVISAGILPPIRAALRAGGVVDRPNARSSHAIATVRGGGLAIVLVCVTAMIFAGMAVRGALVGFALPTVVLAAVSFADDYRPIGARTRLLVHGVAALSAVIWLYRLEPGKSPDGDGWIVGGGLAAAGLWIVGYVNAFNFMDGINGLASTQALITGVGTAALAGAAHISLDHPAAWLALVLAGASLGFLPFNFPRASIFLGDVGSATVGYVLAVLALWLARDSGWSLLVPLACLHLNFVGDTSLTLLRRWRRGEPVMQPHRTHFYQLAVRAGRSHTQVTLIMAMLQAAIVGLALVAVHRGGTRGEAIELCIATLLVWTGFFAWCERAFNRSGGGRPVE